MCFNGMEYIHTGRLRQPDLVSQVQAVVTDEILRQFVHRHVRPLVLPLNKLRYVFADGQVLLVRTLGAVFAHPLGKRPFSLSKARNNVSYSVPMP